MEVIPFNVLIIHLYSFSESYTFSQNTVLKELLWSTWTALILLLIIQSEQSVLCAEHLLGACNASWQASDISEPEKPSVMHTNVLRLSSSKSHFSAKLILTIVLDMHMNVLCYVTYFRSSLLPCSFGSGMWSFFWNLHATFLIILMLCQLLTF